MNNFFNTRRFGLLFTKHTAEHIRTYLMSIAVLTGVVLLGGSFIFFIVPEPPDPGFQTACFVVLMLISGTLFTSTVFSDYGIKSKAITTITLPASSFEKYLVGWLYSYPIFLIVYTGLFYFILLLMSHSGHWKNEQFQIMSFDQPNIIMGLIMYSMLHSFALLGAIVFDKLHFIKTGFVFFAGYAILLIVNTVFLRVLTGVEMVKAAMPFGFLNFMIGNKFYSISASPDTSVAVLTSMCGMAVLFWITAYLKVKEKEV